MQLNDVVLKYREKNKKQRYKRIELREVNGKRWWFTEMRSVELCYMYIVYDDIV